MTINGDRLNKRLLGLDKSLRQAAQSATESSFLHSYIQHSCAVYQAAGSRQGLRTNSNHKRTKSPTGRFFILKECHISLDLTSTLWVEGNLNPKYIYRALNRVLPSGFMHADSMLAAFAAAGCKTWQQRVVNYFSLALCGWEPVYVMWLHVIAMEPTC